MENLLLEKTNELIDLMKQYEKNKLGGVVRCPRAIYSAHVKMDEFANYLKNHLNNDTIKGDESSFVINENKNILVHLCNKKYVAIERESDYDNHYLKCFNCAMYNHTSKECMRDRGFKIPDCEADQRKDEKSVIYVEDRG